MSILNPFADQVRAFSDQDLLRAYQATDGERGHPKADVLSTEIKRRALDV